jgi:hypothetical protein
MITILILSLVGAILSAVIGTFWYSNSTPMGKLHMKYLGFDKLSPEEQKKLIEEAKPKMPKVYGAQMALSFITAFFVVSVTTLAVGSGISLSVTLLSIGIIWLCFVVPTVGTGILWGKCDREIAWKKFFSDIFSNLVTILVISVLASLFA